MTLASPSTARAVVITIVAAAASLVLARVVPLVDPVVPLLVVVGWLAARGGRAAGFASAAVAAVATVAALATSGLHDPATIAVRLVIALGALSLVAWAASAGPDRAVPPEVQRALPIARPTQIADYQALAETLPQVVWTSAADGAVEYFNRRGLVFLGMSIEQARGWSWSELLHPDDCEACLARWSAALASGEPFEGEYRFRRAPDGAYRWHLTRALPIHGDDGAISNWIGTATDIHDQREAVESIRKWVIVFRHSSWGVIVLEGESMRITAANPAYERMHGHAVGTMTGTAVRDAIAPEALGGFEANRAHVQPNGRLVFESVHLRADGSRFPVLIDTTEVRDSDGRILYRVANFLDLTEQRAAATARESAEQGFRAVQDASPDAFTLWDIDANEDGIIEGTLRYVNPAAGRLIGRDLEGAIGQRMSELFPTMKQSARFALYQEVYRTGVTGEITTRLEPVGAWLRVVAIKLADGLGVISTDVTAAKEAEAVLRRSRDELEQLVSDRTRELHQARDLAVLANRAKSDFLSRASHELRTPLSSVIGFSNILLKNKQGAFAADDLTYLSRIARNGRNLLALVNDLLDLSKIEAGRVDLELSPVSLFDLLHEVQDTLEPRAGELGLTLRVDVAQEHDIIIADETRLRQVLVNLTGNAIKYTTRGGVTIRVVANATGAPAHIDVIDTGPGIPADRLDAIFQPFIVDATPAVGDEATGLGLAITRALCDLMGYRLTVMSRLGEGSCFSVHLLKPV